MKVVVYGATGNAGRQIVKELVSRGHQVMAVARDTTKVPAGIATKQDDLSNVDKIAQTVAGADAVVSAYAPPLDDTEQLIPVTERQIAAVKKTGSNVRLIVVGGAASLEVAPGVTLLASGHLPKEWMAIATSHEKALQVLRQSDINWTYFSPAAFFESGERTGRFRLGTDQLISDDKGQSRISFEDYAIALVDEIERPQFECRRFTVGY